MGKRKNQRNRHLTRQQQRAEIENERAFEHATAKTAHGNGVSANVLTPPPPPQTEKQVVERVGEIMERAKSNGSASRQPRFSSANANSIFASVYKWANTLKEPGPNASVRTWDAWLRDLVTEIGAEPHIAGVVNSVVQIDGNRHYSVTGGRNQVNRALRIVQGADNGAGWRPYVKKESLAFWTTRIGAVSEVARDGEGGPMDALYSVDPTLCELTGDPAQPLKYYAPGGVQNWLPEDFFRFASMESNNEKRNGLGFPFTARALDLTRIMIAVWQHDKEELGALAPRGLLILNGISQDQWDTAMDARAETLSSMEREYYGGVAVLAGAGPDEVKAQLMALSQLPKNFNLEQWVSMYMYGLALCAGYDPREFYPVSAGALGTSTETDAQHRKASSKGALDFPLEHQAKLQAEFPPTTLFEYDERDAEGELVEMALQKAKVDLIDVMARWQSGGKSVLSAAQIMQLAAQHGVIPQEWTPEEENVTGDDRFPEADTTLANERVARYVEYVELAIERERAMNPRTVNRVVATLERMAEEPLMVYDSRVGRKRVLLARAGDAMKRRSFPVVKIVEARTDDSAQAPFPHTRQGMPTVTTLRSIAAVTNAFRRDLKAIVSNYFTDKKPEAKSALSNRIKEFVSAAVSDAYFAGMVEAGIKSADFTEDDAQAVDDLVFAQFEHVEGFVDAIVNARGDKDAEQAAIARADLWAASVASAGSLGKMSAQKNKMLTLDGQDGENGCKDCRRLKGKWHRASWWTSRGLVPSPGNPNYECGNWTDKCHHFLRDDEGNRWTGSE